MPRTQFLARLFGLFFLVFAAAFAVNWPAVSAAFGEVVRDPAFLIVSGFLILAAGLAVVLTHNVWRGVTAIVITLLGWASVLKGAFLLCAPPAVVERLYSQAGFAHLQMFYVIAFGAIGVVLTAGGFLPKKTD